MLTFTEFLTEGINVEKLKHLDHIEDHIFDGGHAGMSHIAGVLDDSLNFLSGTKKGSTRFTVKYDGAPAVVFGINPDNHRFFVASKAAFNKNPKLNYSASDIDKNHSNSPGLAAKLKQALEHLPSIMPAHGGVYQGDLMYGPEDLVSDKNTYSFTPNVITYSTGKQSPHGKRIADSKIGIVVHTQYHGDRMANLKADFNVDQNRFNHSSTVNTISPEITRGSIELADRKRFERNLRDATDLYRGLDDDFFNVVKGHEDTLKMYINACVRTSSKPSASGYQQYIVDRLSREQNELKTQKALDRKAAAADLMITHVENHSEQFDTLFKLHGKIQAAKDALTTALSKSQDFRTSIGGNPVKHEGIVAIRGGNVSKLVDRAEYSRANFDFGNRRQKPGTVTEPTNPVVFSFNRMNPPTRGHGAVIDKVTQLADQYGAPHHVVLSSTRDPDRNPLYPEQKLAYANSFWPHANVVLAKVGAPTFLDQARQLYGAGHDHLIVVAGSDRVEEYKRVLDKYNGPDPEKLFNFAKIDVVSAGHRDPDADGVAGVSASALRKHAIHHKFEEFKKGVPDHVPHEHARQLYHDVRRGMNITIDSTTSPISLGKYARRDDIIGARARAERDRRKKSVAVSKLTESVLSKIRIL